MKKYLFFALTATTLFGQDAEISLLDIKNALGKTILEIQEIKRENEVLMAKVKKIEAELVEARTIKKTDTTTASSVKNNVYFVKSHLANIRVAPSKDSIILKTVPADTKLEIAKCDIYGWCKLSNKGYIHDSTIFIKEENK